MALAGGALSGFGAAWVKSRADLKAVRLRIEAEEKEGAELRRQFEEDRATRLAGEKAAATAQLENAAEGGDFTGRKAARAMEKLAAAEAEGKPPPPS